MAQCIAPFDITHDGTTYRVACNKCNFCLQNRRLDWAFRLYQENKKAKSSHFITLTYDTDNVPIHYVRDDLEAAHLALNKEHLFKWHKLVKQHQRREIKKLAKIQKWPKDRTLKQLKLWRPRYYSVGEYGSTTNRPHYHSIMFNLHPNTLNHIARLWGKGTIDVGTVTLRSIAYTTKYLIDQNRTHEREPPFTVMSRNPGLGSEYLGATLAWHKPGNVTENRMYVLYQGHKQRMPRYYKDKAFNNFEKMIAGIKAEAEGQERFNQEIARLAKYSEDPVGLYYEEVNQKHERIRTKSLALNKL